VALQILILLVSRGEKMLNEGRLGLEGLAVERGDVS
jgi:hypothetical protein